MASIYEDVSSLPEFSLAWIHDQGYSLTASTRNYTTFESYKTIIDIGNGAATPTILPTDAKLVSQRGDVKVLFREKDGKTSLEVWKNLRLYSVTDLSGVHGDLHLTEAFGVNLGKDVSWHQDGKHFLYVAEKLADDHIEQDYIPDFGDSLLGKRHPVTVLVDLTDLQSPRVAVVVESEADGSVAYGQSIFVGNDIVASGYHALKDGRRLGVIYCQNRVCQLYRFSVDLQDPKVTKGEAFTDIHRSARFARSDGKHLVYLSNAVGGPHGSCNQLHIQPLPLGSPELLVKEVGTPASLTDFPGLFVGQLQPAPFLSNENGSFVVVVSAWRSRMVPLLVSTADASVKNLAPWPKPGIASREELSSYQLLAASGTQVLFARALLNHPAEVVSWKLDSPDKIEVIWTPEIDPKTQGLLDSVSVAVLPIPDADPTEIIFSTAHSTVYKELRTLADEGKAFLVPRKSKASSSNPALPFTINNPHGGPHMSESTGWNSTRLAQTLTGYNVAQINFVGSTGFGQDAVLKLMGAVGTTDVDACLAVRQYIIDTNLGAQGKQFIEGLSHGGFLSAHLSGRYPDKYQAAVLRNPVVDLASMFLHNTDIPDWTLAEPGLDSDPFSIPIRLNAEQFQRMSASSPIHAVDNVTCPTLLLISLDDHRVIPTQGKAWYHGIKAAGKAKVAAKTYKGEIHGLDGVEAGRGAFLATLDWYKQVE